MRHRVELPAQLGSQFSIREASAHGIRKGRADASDLARPFHGVRSLTAPETFHDLVGCYGPRLRPGQRFVGVSAVRLWHLPHPADWTSEEALEVAVPQEQSPPRARGVAGRRLARARAESWRLKGVPVVDPVAAIFSCAAELTVDQLVILLDAVISTSTGYPGFGAIVGRPMVTLDEVRTRLAAWGRFPGNGRVRAALPSVRDGVESPKETETRLAIVHAGLPEPQVQFVVRDGSRFVARVDLAYPDLRIAIEYEGDGHRTSKDQWRRDIARQRDLERCGWIVIRLTEDDLRNPQEFLDTLRRALLAPR